MRRLIFLVLFAVTIAGAIWLARGEHDETPVASSTAHRSNGPDSLPAFATSEADATTAPSSVSLVAEPENAAADSGATLELRVHHADGAPARGCALVVAVAEHVVWAARADDDGVARGVAVAGPAAVWVAGATLVPVSLPLPEARGRQELSLPPGEVIDGRIEIDGGPPPEPLLLGLSPHDPVDVPRAVSEAFIFRQPGTAVPGLDEAWGSLVDADGSFHFSALPTGWEGRFEIPYTYFTDDDHALHVAVPEHGRVLLLHRVPHLHFRVVSAGAREPVPFAQALVMCSAAGNTTTTSFICGADGRGDVAMQRWGQTLSTQLDLSAPDGMSRIVRSFDLATPNGTPSKDPPWEQRPSGHDVDLGDVELKPRWAIAFHVTDIGGAPLEGAIGAVECEQSLRSEPTGPDGLGRLNGVSPGCSQLLVGAPAHQMVRVPLPVQEPSEPIEVALAPCATLSVHFSSDDGAPRAGLRLELTSTCHLSAADAMSLLHDSLLTLGTHLPNSASGFRDTEDRQPDGSVVRTRKRHWSLRELGDYDLGCMDAGSPITLRLVDDLGHPIWSEALSLQEGEHRVVSAVVSARPSDFSLLVSDKAGTPLEGVEVSAWPSDIASAEEADSDFRWESDTSGKVEIGAYAAVLNVRCEKDGYVATELQGVQPGVVGHVQMGEGLSVLVRVVGPEDRPAIADSATCDNENHPATSVDPMLDESGLVLGSSSWRFTGLQPGPMTIVVCAGGRRFSFEHEASEPEATLRVPAFGALLVHGLQPAKGLAASLVRAFPDGSDKGGVFRKLDLGTLSRDAVRLPLVFAGRYRVELAGGDRDTRRLSGPVYVEVKAGETAAVSLP